MIKVEPQKHKNITLNQQLQDILHPIFRFGKLSYGEWMKEAGFRRSAGFAYYVNACVEHRFVHKGEYEKEYGITEKGIMIYCAMIDKPIEHFIEHRAKEAQEISYELQKIRRRIKGFYK